MLASLLACVLPCVLACEPRGGTIGRECARQLRERDSRTCAGGVEWLISLCTTG